MPISENIIPTLASIAGINAILLALFSTILCVIDPVASLFSYIAIPFALLSLLSKQKTLWIKIFAILFILTQCLYISLY